MFRTIADFESSWRQESQATSTLLRALTDASLAQELAPGSRSLGRVAWHITLTLGEMIARTGLTLAGPGEDEAVPARAKTIAEAYEGAARSLLDQVKSSWTDETLGLEDDMYGERWARGRTLFILILHQAHHRGQMTALMRQAGLVVTGVCGPAREEWAAFGMQAPAV